MAAAHRTPQGRSRAVTVAGAALVGVVAAVALAGTLDRSFWRDEAATASAEDRGLGEMLRLLGHEEGGLAAYYLLLRPWTALAGTTETVLRVPSLLAAVATLVLAALLGRRLGGVPVGVGAAAVLALHPTFLPVYAVEARPPAIAAALVTAAGLVAHRLAGDGGRRWRWAWSLLAAAAIALALLSVLAIVPQVVWVLRRRSGRTRSAATAALAVPAVTLAVATTLAARDRGLQSWIRAQPLRLVRDLGTIALGPAALWLVGAAAVGLGVVAFARRVGRRPSGPADAAAPSDPTATSARRDARIDVAVLAAWWVGPLLVLVAWTEVAVPVFTPRYLLSSAPAGAVLAAVLVGRALAAARGLGRLPAAVVAVLVLAGGAIGVDRAVDAGALRRAEPIEDLRAAADLISSDVRPGDVVLYAPRWSEAGVRWYLADRPGAPADAPGDLAAGPTSAVAAGSLWTPPVDRAAAEARLDGAARVWIVGYPGDRTWEPVPEVGHPLAATIRACWERVATTDAGIVVEVWRRPATTPSGCPDGGG